MSNAIATSANSQACRKWEPLAESRRWILMDVQSAVRSALLITLPLPAALRLLNELFRLSLAIIAASSRYRCATITRVEDGTNERSLFANERSEQWLVTSRGRSPSKLATKKIQRNCQTNKKRKTEKEREKTKYIVIHKIAAEKYKKNY